MTRLSYGSQQLIEQVVEWIANISTQLDDTLELVQQGTVQACPNCEDNLFKINNLKNN